MPTSMSGDLAARIAAFLDAYHVMSLATCGAHGAHAANVFYERDGFSLLWVSEPQTRHSLALETNPRVGATIAPDYHDFYEIRGVQISGDARCITDAADRDRARCLLEARYPFLRCLADRPAIKEAYGAAKFYRLIPYQIVLIDNTRGFGHKDVLDLKSSE